MATPVNAVRVLSLRCTDTDYSEYTHAMVTTDKRILWSSSRLYRSLRAHGNLCWRATCRHSRTLSRIGTTLTTHDIRRFAQMAYDALACGAVIAIVAWAFTAVDTSQMPQAVPPDLLITVFWVRMQHTIHSCNIQYIHPTSNIQCMQHAPYNT